MSELEYDRLLDAVGIAVAFAPEKSLVNKPAKAAKDSPRRGPVSRPPQNCYGFR